MSATNAEHFPASSRLRPRRTLNRLAWAGLAVLLAAGGQALFRRLSLWDGLLFYAAGAVLFVRALHRTLPPLDPTALVAGYRLRLAAGRRRTAGAWLVALSVVCSGIAFVLFSRPETPRPAWWLYLGSLAVFILGSLIFTRGDGPRRWLVEQIPSRRIGLALGGILLLALALRLYRFGDLPFGIWYDEAEAGLQARQMLARADYRPLFYAPINITGHLLGLYALALRWLGDNIHSMRLVSVGFGLGGVAAAYLFGRELRGPRFGLLLALLIAAARWHINFSRIAMTGIDTPFFELLSLYFLTRLLRRGHLRDAAWAGLSLGMGLMFYTAFRLFLAAVGIFAVLAALRWQGWVVESLRQTRWRGQLARLGVLVLAAWLAAMPLVEFALRNPDDFMYRTRQISILTRRDQPNLALALWTTTRKHLLMFNFQGDKNGRHNLPGEPMLDPLTGMLFVLGLALALTRRRPADAFFLLLFPLGLAGGILSVDFEAPQSLRSIAAMPAVLYFAALAAAELGREAENSLTPLPRTVTAVPAAVLAGFIIFSNAHTYFVRQAGDFASWNAFSGPETATGYKMAQLGPDHLYLLSPFLVNHPTTRFIAPDIPDQQPLPLPDALPVRRPPDRPVTLFIHPDDAWVYEQARQFYPNAAFEVVRGPAPQGEGPPVVYIVTLQPADLAAVQGLDLRYLPAGQENPSPVQVGLATAIQADWPADAPVAETPLVAEWRGVLYVPEFGPYAFRLTAPGPARLEIDGNPVLEGEGEQSTGLTLAQGNHTFLLQADVMPGSLALHWQAPARPEEPVPQWVLYHAPVSAHGLLGSYYANDRWEGRPAFQRVDPFLDTYFHLTPLHRPYTVEWQGMLDAPRTGIYRLGLRAVTQAELYVDGQRLLVTATPDVPTDQPVNLTAGLHEIRIRYLDSTDRSRIHLLWTTPDGEMGPVPSRYLWPPMGRYPKAAEPPPAVSVKPLSLTWLESIGGAGSEAAQFLEPRDVAVLPDGRLVVADTGNRRLQVLDPQGAPLRLLTGDPFPFEEPLAVGVNSRGEILALDSTLQWVYRFDSAGNLLNRFGGPTAYLFHPRGLTVLADDTVVLADTGKSRLVFFSPDGQQAGTIGGLGDGPGQFNEPTDVLQDDQATYFVAEAMNNRIQRVDQYGSYLTHWPIPPAYAYNGPHLAFGPDGSLFVTESQSRSLLRFSPQGDLLDSWQSIGPVNLAAPVGIYFDPQTDRLYLTDVAAHQVHVFAVRVEE